VDHLDVAVAGQLPAVADEGVQRRVAHAAAHDRSPAARRQALLRAYAQHVPVHGRGLLAVAEVPRHVVEEGIHRHPQPPPPPAELQVVVRLGRVERAARVADDRLHVPHDVAAEAADAHDVRAPAHRARPVEVGLHGRVAGGFEVKGDGGK
jgi:hypothetical protein